jgi:DegV family protein with EDD domain
MPRIRVVTDSACDIPENLVRQLEIVVLPLRLTWGSEVYLDRTGISSDETLARVRAGLVPEIEGPPVEEFSRTYRGLRESADGVISLHHSARLTDTYANSAIAREAFGPVGAGGPFPVGVVDTQSVSMGLGWVALAVARAAAGGMDLPKLVGLAGRLSGQSHFAFFTEHTDVLLKSGRVGRLASQLDSLSSLRPLFHLDEGSIAVYERTRTRAKARDALYNFVEDFPKIGELCVVHTNITQNDVEHLLTRIGAIYPRERVMIVRAGPALASWLGPDAMGVAVLEGEE